MTKMYSAIDKVDGVESLFLLNALGVLVTERGFHTDVHLEVKAAKILEQVTPPYMYSTVERFDDAICLTLLAEW